MKPFYVVVLALLLSACGLLQTTEKTAPMPDNSTLLLDWHISGKIGIRLPDDAHSAYVEWTQHANAFDVLLFGPLGQGKSRLKGKPGVVELSLANGDVWNDKSPEALLMKLYGWQLPISRAQYWVKGLAAPDTAAVTKFNADGSLAHLEQDGWDIDYLNYQETQSQETKSIRLPQKLIMHYDQVRVTLIVKQWQALSSQ